MASSAAESVFGNSDEAERWELAKRALQERDLAQAERLCLTLPKTPLTLAFLGQIFALSHRPDRAIAVLNQSLELEPDRVDTLHLLLAVFRKLKRQDQVAEVAERIACLSPQTAEILNTLGLTYLDLGQYEEAVSTFSKLLKIVDGPKPKLAAIHYNLGYAFRKLNRLAEAASEFESATRFEPERAEYWDSLGHVVALMDSQKAVEYFRQGAEVALPGPGRDLIRAKALLYGQGDLREAEECLLRVLDAKPESFAAHSLLGNVRLELGHFVDAQDSLRKAIAIQPEAAAPYYGLVLAKKVQESDRPLVNLISEKLANPKLAEVDRITFLYAKGKAANDLGNYQEGLECYKEVNIRRQRMSGAVFDREAFTAQVDHIVNRFTRSLLEQKSSISSELPVFVTGMPRSGTTVTDRVLSAHPEVVSAGELAFWNDRIPDSAGFDPSPLNLQELANDFLRILEEKGPNAKRVTDKSPVNFWHIGPILLALPNAKIIHVKRHPVDNCLSIFMTKLAYPPGFAYRPEDLVFGYRGYQRLMAHWREVVPGDRLLEIRYEDLVQDQEATARKLIQFCGLPWHDACLSPEQTSGEIRTASLWQARQPIYKSSVERWRRYEPWLGAFRELLDET